jgi:hypothetical protein
LANPIQEMKSLFEAFMFCHNKAVIMARCLHLDCMLFLTDTRVK